MTEFLAAKQDPAKLKTVLNTILGELWEDRGAVRPYSLKERLEAYSAEVPEGAGLLTASVDVQDDRLEAVVKAWGKGEESWLVAFHVSHGSPAKLATWFDMDKLLTSTFEHASGKLLTIRSVMIDSGGHHTDDVYKFVQPRQSRLVNGKLQNVAAIKGQGGGHEVVGRPSKRNRYRIALFPIGTDAAKDIIYARLQSQTPGPGYIHLNAAVADDEYLAQLTAEKAVKRYSKGRGAVREYVAIRERNEALDLEVYALAALYRLARGKRLIRLLENAVTKANEKEESQPVATPETPPPAPSPSRPPSVPPRIGGGFVNAWR